MLRTLGYIGSLRRTKGVHLLLDALPMLAEMGLTLRIAGEGPMRAEIEAVAATTGALRYDGPVFGEERKAFFEDCDAGIAPSVWPEPGSPNYAVLEWLAAGRPVVVSIRGGLAEAVDVFGGVVAIEPTQRGILESVNHLLEPQNWSELVAAVQPVPDGSDEDRWIREHERIYRTAVNEPGRT